ncbi:MAG: histidine phosphatase family protein [Propionibacteriaceae bacterium]|nr:histidine phosphatase family protein [Propionibacteriaceae bacterium]
MHLLLIRHGQSHNNTLYEKGLWHERIPEPGLTELGQAQANALAKYFSDGRLPRPDALYTSLMRRALQTSAPIAEALGLPAIGRSDLHEVMAAGENCEGAEEPYPGLQPAELCEENPALVVPEDADDTGWYHEDFETPAQASARARNLLAELDAAYGVDDVVAIVSHGWFMQYLIQHFCSWVVPDDGVTTWIDIHNTGTCYLLPGAANEFSGRVIVRWLDGTSHLNKNQLTK